MTVVGVGTIPIKPDFGNFHKDVQREGAKAADGLTSHFKGAFKSIAALGGGILVGAGLVSGLKSAFAEAAEAQKVGKLTEQVIKTTGGAAKITAKQIGDLSTAISNKAGIDDEAIQSGANLVATFTKVRNEAGKGNDIFSQTVQVATDMSVALGQDMKSSSLQLGKALNDPIKGITALSRAGVSFTADQKAQIKVLQESGDILGAQKIILKEVGTEFGGAAAAAASPVDKLKVVWGNLLETLGTKALPIVGKVADWLAKVLPDALDKAGDAFRRVSDFLAPSIAVLKAFFYTLTSGFTEDEGTPVERFALRVRDVFFTLLDAGRTAYNFITGTLIPGISQVIGSFVAGFKGEGGPGSILTDLGEAARGAMRVFKEDVLPVIQSLVSWIGDHLKPILIGLGIAFVVLTGPIAILVGAFIFAYQKFQWFRDGVELFMGIIKAVITTAIDVIVVVFKGIVWTIQNVVMPIFNTLKVFLVDFVFPLIGAVIKDIIVPAFQDIWHTVQTVWDFVKPIFEAIVKFISEKLAPVWSAITDAAKMAFNALPGLIGAALRLVGGIISGFLDGVGSIADALGLPNIGPELHKAASSARGWGQGGTSNNTGQGQGGISVQGGTRRAMGGPIPGSGRGDHVQILAEPGEFMIRRSAVDKYGTSLMEAINAGRFAKGGLIPHIPGIDLDGIVRKGRQLGASALDSVWPKLPTGSGAFSKLGIPAGGVNYMRDAVIALIRGSTSPSGSGAGMSGSVADWIHQAMGLTGVPESWFGPLMARVKLESGGNPLAINKWDSNALKGTPSMGLMQTIRPTFDRYKLPGHCVPLTAEVLTRSGWKTYDQIDPGDETIGFNPETGRNEWTLILDHAVFEDQPVVEMQRKGWQARVTPHHKWSVKRRVNISKSGPVTHVRRNERVGTMDLRASDQVRLAEPAEGGTLDIKPSDAALLGWLMTDGCVMTKRIEGSRHKATWPEWGEEVGVAQIFQSKPEQLGVIEALLADVPHTHRINTGRPFGGEGGCIEEQHVWNIQPSVAREVIGRSRIAETGPIGFVAALSEEAREAWLNAVVLADGNWTAADTPYICQNEGDLLDAMVLAGYLCGYRPSVAPNGADPKCRKVYLCKPHVSGESVRITEAGSEDVWCPTTGLGTWTMRLDGHVMLTSNSDIWNPVDNASAAIRYILARYGSIFNVNPHTGYALGGLVAHQRPFDQGGVLEPGLNLVNNTTGGREGVYPSRSGPLIGSVHLNDREAVDEFWRRTLFETTAHAL